MVVPQSSSFQTDFEADILKAKPVFLLLRRRRKKSKHKLYIGNLSQYRTVRLGIKVVAFASTEQGASPCWKFHLNQPFQLLFAHSNCRSRAMERMEIELSLRWSITTLHTDA